jgi:hypothetical protein
MSASQLAEAERHFLTGDINTMRRLSVLCATAFIAVTALAATSPAEAAFHVIRWHDTGFCQVQDQNFPVLPWPAHYTTVTHRLPTFTRAMAVKEVLMRRHVCTF